MWKTQREVRGALGAGARGPYQSGNELPHSKEPTSYLGEILALQAVSRVLLSYTGRLASSFSCRYLPCSGRRVAPTTFSQELRSVHHAWWPGSRAGPLLLVLNSVPALAEPQESHRGPDVVDAPTPSDVVAQTLQMAEVKKGDVVYDLGCGGRPHRGHRRQEVRRESQRIRHLAGTGRRGWANAKKNGVDHLVTIGRRTFSRSILAPRTSSRSTCCRS